jgi:glucokinase
VLAIDVGGTDLKAALVDGDVQTLAFRSQPTPPTPTGIVDAVAQLVDEWGPAAAVGLSRAGAALFDPLTERIPRQLTFQRVPRLVPAALGDRAGCMGAGLLALDSIRGGT